ncbi:MAG: ATP-binding protein, partial [Myxococcota bacterium]
LKSGAQDFLLKDKLGGADLGRSVQFAVERQRAAELRARLDHADRLAAIGRLSAGIAHEVNNPATVLMSNIELMRDTIRQGGGLEEFDELLIDCEQSITRIAALMRQLGGVSRRSSQGTVWVDLRSVVEEGVRLALPSVRHRAVIDVDAQDVPKVVADRSAIAGVFINLLVNAQDAIDAGRRNGRLQGRIRVELAETTEYVVLKVEDSGPGIDPVDAQRIFEPFVSGSHSGSGLGLSVSKEVVDAHRGQISVDRSPRLGGARFTVSLPKATGLMYIQTPRAASSLRGLTILVIDDEPPVHKALQRMLRTHHLVPALTLQQADMALDDGLVPDVVLCDLMLSRESGIDFFKRIQTEKPDLVDRFLFFTGGGVTPQSQHFLQLTHLPVVTKPFSKDELIAALSKVVDTDSGAELAASQLH